MSLGKFEQQDYQQEEQEQIIQENKALLENLKKEILDNNAFSGKEKNEVVDSLQYEEQAINTSKEQELTINQSPVNRDLAILLGEIKQSLVEQNPSQGGELFHTQWKGESGEIYTNRKQKRIDAYTNTLALETEHHLLTPSKYSISDPHLQDYVNTFNNSLQVAAINDDKAIASDPAIANHSPYYSVQGSDGNNWRNHYTNSEIGDTGYENHSRRTIA